MIFPMSVLLDYLYSDKYADGSIRSVIVLVYASMLHIRFRQCNFYLLDLLSFWCGSSPTHVSEVALKASISDISFQTKHMMHTIPWITKVSLRPELYKRQYLNTLFSGDPWLPSGKLAKMCILESEQNDNIPQPFLVRVIMLVNLHGKSVAQFC